MSEDQQEPRRILQLPGEREIELPGQSRGKVAMKRKVQAVAQVADETVKAVMTLDERTKQIIVACSKLEQQLVKHESLLLLLAEGYSLNPWKRLRSRWRVRKLVGNAVREVAKQMKEAKEQLAKEKLEQEQREDEAVVDGDVVPPAKRGPDGD